MIVQGASRVRRPFRPADPDWHPSEPVAYCYVLGLYLGDGHIVHSGTSAWLRLTLDALYPEIVDEAQDSLSQVFPDARVARYVSKRCRKIDLQLSDASLPYAFPQAGPGRKHHRRIELTSWQTDLTRRYPERLVRGLIHSDGCRTVNRFAVVLPSGRTKAYEYPRYFFSNLSEDIRRIFCEHCDLLGIRWTSRTRATSRSPAARASRCSTAS